MSICLSKVELRELTGKCQREHQKRALRSMGIKYAETDTGAIRVLRAAVEKRMLGTAANDTPTTEPNWSAFG